MSVHRLKLALFMGILLAGVSPALAQKSSGQQSISKHLAIAMSLVSHLDLANTNYEHGAPSVSFTAPFASHTDCSGFIDALLGQAYGFDKDQLKQWFGSSRPTARRYHDAIDEGNGFKKIEHVQDIQPGDLLAVKYFNNKSNTGHVMLVAARPERMAAKEPLLPGTAQWSVTVIDSSESGHGPTDTRHKKGTDGKDHDGLGEGVLRIYSDAAGSVTGFAWSTLASSKFKEPTDEHLVIGRLDRK